MTVYARYDGNNAPSYITPGKLYEALEHGNRGFSFMNNWGTGSFATWEECPHLRDDNWTRIEVDDMTKQAHPSAQILREIADEAAVNPDPHLAFEQRCPASDWVRVQDWHAPPDLASLVASVEYMDMGVGWQVRRKPKTVRAEGEIPQSAIDYARVLSLHGGGGHGEAQIVARALLELVEGE